MIETVLRFILKRLARQTIHVEQLPADLLHWVAETPVFPRKRITSVNFINDSYLMPYLWSVPFKSRVPILLLMPTNKYKSKMQYAASYLGHTKNGFSLLLEEGIRLLKNHRWKLFESLSDQWKSKYLGQLLPRGVLPQILFSLNFQGSFVQGPMKRRLRS